LEAANTYLEEELFAWWNKTLTCNRRDIRTGMRKAMVTATLDATIAVRFQDHTCACAGALTIANCSAAPGRRAKPPKPAGKPKRKPDWMNNFSLQSGPSLRVKRTFLLCLDRQPNAKRPEWLD